MNAMDRPEGAVRVREVPPGLRKKSNKEILAWAREQLNGQEPNLNQKTLMRIRSGEQTVVKLQPRQPGFFLPGGEFVPAYEHAPEFGEDLDESDKLWAAEEHDREWVDHENEIFNR